MKHAFLIIAHDNFWQLGQLIRLLDSESHDLYVHIGKRCKTFNAEQIASIPLKSKLFVFSEYKVYWGGYSIIETEMLLMEKACENHYDYYHIISGADLPLRNNRDIDDFFEKNKGLEFVDFNDQQLRDDPEIARRTRLFHLLQNYRRITSSKAVNSLFVFCERVLLLLQIILRVDRTKNLEWTIKYGSQWVSITDGLVKEIISNKAKIRSVFRYTNCADELFIQTIAYNTGYRDKIYHSSANDVRDNMRLVDWKRGSNGSPYTYREEDYDELINSGALFARKFSEDVDKNIIKKIVDYVGNQATI